MKKKLSIPKNYLILIAGIVWMFAGFMVMKIGVPIFMNIVTENIIILILSCIVFLIFYLFIFSKLVVKHTNRIKDNPSKSMPFWQFFDLPSYIIMAVMMSGGIWLRSANVLPIWFIGFFYSGLGLALFSCGTRFVSVFFRKKVLV